MCLLESFQLLITIYTRTNKIQLNTFKLLDVNWFVLKVVHSYSKLQRCWVSEILAHLLCNTCHYLEMDSLYIFSIFYIFETCFIMTPKFIKDFHSRQSAFVFLQLTPLSILIFHNPRKQNRFLNSYCSHLVLICSQRLLTIYSHDLCYDWKHFIPKSHKDDCVQKPHTL